MTSILCFLFLVLLFDGVCPQSYQELQPADVEIINDKIVELIKATKKTIDIVMWDLSYEPIYNSIRKACSRNVYVRMYVDYDQNIHQDSSVNKLIQDFPDQVEVIFDTRKVNAKVIISDGIRAYAGTNGWDDESIDTTEFLLISLDQDLVSEFIQAFNELFPDSDVITNSIAPGQSVSGEASVVYLKRGVSQEYLTLIKTANKSIQAAMFNFTDEHIYTNLVSAAARNISIFLYLDGTNNHVPGSYSKLLQGSFPDLVTVVYSYDFVKMHCTFAIFDGKLVAMGSSDWSPEGHHNLEALVVSTDSSLVQESLENLEWLAQNDT